MKNFVLISLLAVIFTSCVDPNIGSANRTTSELLVRHGWQLDKFTDTQGVTISDGRISSSAKALYGMAFEFRVNSEVRGIAKTSKTVVNRGEWLINGKILDIDIVGFKGDFEVVHINNTSMILRAQNEDATLGLGPEVHLIFSEFNL